MENIETVQHPPNTHLRLSEERSGIVEDVIDSSKGSTQRQGAQDPDAVSNLDPILFVYSL
jgi:hypothetical protein